MEGYHNPVMLKECLDELRVQPNGIYVDATMGGGGHTRAIIRELGTDGHLYAFDTDADTITNIPNDDKLTFIQANYRHIKRFLRLHKVTKVNGILADFGISSFQIDTAERGFSIRYDAPLDMRMNRQQTLSAFDVVNTFPYEKLVEIFSEYGEVINSKTLARNIVDARITKPISTTGELVTICKKAVRGKEPRYLAQAFQAIRIEVNDEINAIKEFLQQSSEVLQPGGRLVILTYHSLEDRPVKNFLRNGTFGDEPEKDLYGRFTTPFKMVYKKPLEPSEAEIKNNPRARSAKLRVAEKI